MRSDKITVEQVATKVATCKRKRFTKGYDRIHKKTETNPWKPLIYGH